jgi:dye decolorizing peroxidase
MGDQPSETPRRYSRRRLLLTGAAAAAGGAATVAIGGVALAAGRESSAGTAAVPTMDASTGTAGSDGAATVPFHGPHQAGISTPAQAYTTFCAFDLREGVDDARLTKLLKILTDDLERIMSGRPALGDTAPELAATPARVSVTIGFGPALFDKVGLGDARPAGFADLPAFPEIDRLENRYSGGDLLLQIGADDPITLAHTQRMLLKDTRAFAATRWVQRGFLRARGSGSEGSTPRNVMGQVDGTVNPRTDADFDQLVWHPGPGWFTGGTMMVLRRIRMDLNAWDALDRSAMETAVGRRLANGAPLTGTQEHDDPDLTATDATGLLAIADFAHLRLARGDGPAPQILRRPYNYDESPGPDGDSDLGQLFCSFQADIAAQFVPMQQRLAVGDLMNQWITPIGSAVFAIPPGCQPGGFIGEGLLT